MTKITTAKWRVDTPALIKEMVECNPSAWILGKPGTIFVRILGSLAERAIKLDDPELNILMLRLGLYDTAPADISEAIQQQEDRIPR